MNRSTRAAVAYRQRAPLVLEQLRLADPGLGCAGATGLGA